jgi:hypothetical protein
VQSGPNSTMFRRQHEDEFKAFLKETDLVLNHIGKLIDPAESAALSKALPEKSQFVRRFNEKYHDESNPQFKNNVLKLMRKDNATITRANFYDLIHSDWYMREVMSLKDRGELLLSSTLEEDAEKLSVQIACLMFGEKKSVTDREIREKIFKTYPAASLPVLEQALAICPLQKTGDSYQFIHDSSIEYFATKRMFDEMLAESPSNDGLSLMAPQPQLASLKSDIPPRPSVNIAPSEVCISFFIKGFSGITIAEEVKGDWNIIKTKTVKEFKEMFSPATKSFIAKEFLHLRLTVAGREMRDEDLMSHFEGNLTSADCRITVVVKQSQSLVFKNILEGNMLAYESEVLSRCRGRQAAQRQDSLRDIRAQMKNLDQSNLGDEAKLHSMIKLVADHIKETNEHHRNVSGWFFWTSSSLGRAYQRALDTLPKELVNKVLDEAAHAKSVEPKPRQ